jgi:hypothetical protein
VTKKNIIVIRKYVNFFLIFKKIPLPSASPFTKGDKLSSFSSKEEVSAKRMEDFKKRPLI